MLNNNRDVISLQANQLLIYATAARSARAWNAYDVNDDPDKICRNNCIYS